MEARVLARGYVLSEARYRALVDASPMGIYSTDAQGNCTYTNARWQGIYGLKEAEALGLGWARSLHPSDREAVFAHWQQTAAHGQNFEMSFRVRHPDASVRHLRTSAKPVRDADGVLTGFVGATEDTTAQVVAKHNKAQLLDAVSQHFIVSITDAQGTLLEVSDAFCRASQRSRDELLGANHRCVKSDHHPAEFFVGMWVVLSNGQSWRGEICNRAKDGSAYWIDCVIAPLLSSSGDPDRMVSIAIDITRRKQQDAALKVAHQRLHNLVEGTHAGTWEWFVPTGELVVNERWAEMLGWTLAELGAIHHRDRERLIHPDDLHAVQQARTLHFEGHAEAFVAEARLKHRLGHWVWVQKRGRLVSRTPDGQPGWVYGIVIDISQQKVQEAQLRRLADELAEQHERLRVTLQSIGDAVITTDAQAKVTWLNPVAERMTGWPLAEAQSKPMGHVFNILHQDTRLPAPNPVEACLAQQQVVGMAARIVLVSRDGVEFGIEDSAAPIRNAQGQVLGVVLVFHDVTEQRRLSGEMSFRATHDALTGLFNRTEFESRLQRALSQSHETGGTHALLYIDLDQFKLVNDACGHSAGDQLLQQVSKLMGEVVRSRDTLARLGGDEFAVILEHCTPEQAQRVAQQICERMDDFRFSHDGRRFRIGTSIGLVPVDKRFATLAAVMQAADTSCYAAKEEGRNRVHLWFDTDAAMRARHGEMQWATRLEQALDDNRFELFIQRIDPAQASPAALHAEVLLRLRETDGSLVPPGAFLPAAERFHMASRIDRWVLTHVLAHLQALPSLKVVDLLCVNLSGISVGDRAFHRQTVEQLRAAGPDVCQRLCLEITETAAITNLHDASLFIDQVRALGVRVALDDFGAGASSFGYLKQLKVDLIKIDGQFVKDIVDDPLDAAAVRCFADVARLMGLPTIAEFVHNADVLDRVRALGIDYVQGYHLHQPEPIAGLLPVQPVRV
jgi:diguanylate cyclase